LQKWFFDVLLPGNAYVYFYITHIKFFGFSVSRFNLHYRSETRILSFSEKIDLQIIDPNNFSGKSAGFRKVRGGFVIEIHKRYLDICLLYKNPDQFNYTQFNPDFISYNNRKIEWYPLILKGQPEGRLNLKDFKIQIRSCEGYIDYVCSTVLPNKVPISELYWGRLHHKELDFSYSITFDNNKQLATAHCLCRLNNQFLETDKTEIKIHENGYSEELKISYPRVIELTSMFKSCEITLLISQGEKLIESGFFDEQQNINKLLIKSIKTFSKNPLGIKFLSDVQVEIKSVKSIHIDGLKLISEYVRFF